MTMNKKLIVLILLLALSICLAACFSAKDDSSGINDNSSGSTGDSSEANDDSSGTYDDFAYVTEKGSMIIGYTVYEPMNYTDAGGNFTGFDTELARAVCAKLELEPNFVEINWDTKEIELSAKSIDCIWNGLTITDERKENMAITIPYVKNAQVVVMKANAAYTDTSSLIGKTVCAEMKSAGEEAINDDENLQNANYISKEIQTACLMEVAAGTADAAVLDLTLAKAMIGPGTDYSNLAIKDRLAVEDYGIAFRKGSSICEKVNTVLRDLVADGTLKALADKYGLDLSE